LSHTYELWRTWRQLLTTRSPHIHKHWYTWQKKYLSTLHTVVSSQSWMLVHWRQITWLQGPFTSFAIFTQWSHHNHKYWYTWRQIIWLQGPFTSFAMWSCQPHFNCESDVTLFHSKVSFFHLTKSFKMEKHIFWNVKTLTTTLYLIAKILINLTTCNLFECFLYNSFSFTYKTILMMTFGWG